MRWCGGRAQVAWCGSRGGANLGRGGCDASACVHVVAAEAMAVAAAAQRSRRWSRRLQRPVVAVEARPVADK